MTQIKFDDREAHELKEFYKRELEKTLEHLEHIQKVLSKFEGVDQHIEINISSGATDGRSTVKTAGVTGSSTRRASTVTGARSAGSRGGKKRGPKSKWGSYILKKLKQSDQPLTYNELIEEAKKSSVKGIKGRSEESIRQSILNSAFRLRTQQEEVETFGLPGSKEKFVALRSWFDGSGNIKPEYMAKAENKRGTEAPSGKTTRRKTTTRKKRTAKKAPSAPVTRTTGIQSKPVMKRSGSGSKSSSSKSKSTRTKSTAKKSTGTKSTASRTASVTTSRKSGAKRGPKPSTRKGSTKKSTSSKTRTSKSKASNSKSTGGSVPSSAKNTKIPTKSVKTKKVK